MESLLSLYRLAEAQGIVADSFQMQKREALSILDETDGRCYIGIDPFKLTGGTDEKLKLAHELGHCMTGSFYNEDASCDIRQKHENKADKWAVEKVIPVDELDEAIADGYSEIWSLADHFGVTEAFMKKAICWHTYENLAAELYF